MTTKARDTSESDPDRDNRSDAIDPRDTDHPTGAEQADENAANESPS
jgi:hypothetical protein